MHLLLDARVIQDHFPGIGRYAYNLARALPAALAPGERATVMYSAQAANTRFTNLEALNVPGQLHMLDYSAPVFGLANLARNLGQVAPDSDLCHHCYYVRPVRSPRPAITTIYDTISFNFPQYVPGLKQRLAIGLLHRLAVAASDAVITISESAAGDLRRIFPRLRQPGRLHVTPLGVDEAFAPASADAVAGLRTRLQLPERFALYLASNKPHKNLPRLLQAWAHVQAKRSGAGTLVIAGHQDLRFGNLAQHVASLQLEGSVRLLGDVAARDLATLYSACDFFVFPSLYEGFGLTPLEAMACGAAVACSNAGSLPEVCGDATLLFNPESVEAMADACIRLVDDNALRHDLGARGLRQSARFSWQATANATTRVYRDMLARRRGA